MIKLLILDVDGVMTGGIKYYDREGTVKLKTFCDKDWTAIKRFVQSESMLFFLTGDPCSSSASLRTETCTSLIATRFPQ